MANARVVLTDSGGVQEETTILGIPCVTIRRNTERPVTISEGTNVLAGTERHRILQAVARALDGSAPAPRFPERWDGRAGERIVRILMAYLGCGDAAIPARGESA
jgi:UDP-N-acetylglucosamine 2-epimerase (non-hydrolysing)